MYLGLLFTCLILVVVWQIRWAWSRRQTGAASWDALLNLAEKVDLENLHKIAECYLNPSKEQFKRQPAEMWDLMGGLDGMNSLYRNAELMLKLAVFAEQWQHPDAALVAELIRRDGIRVKKLITRMQFHMVLHRLPVSLALDLQEAVGTYCQMRSRLMGLYETCHVGRLPALAAVL